MLHGTLDVEGRRAAWWFTDRMGGVSPEPFATRNLAAHVSDDPASVRANRQGLEAELAAGPLSWMGPVHGTDLVVLAEPRSITPNVDALATVAAAVPLVTLGADCVPMLIAAGDLVVAAHVGWRGLVEGMTAQLLDFLRQRGIDPASAQVLLGPAICGSCFGIPVARAELIGDACPKALVVARNGGPGADIRVGLAAEWQAAGATVTLVGPCTAEDASLFSHRRDGVTGRQAGVIAWMP
jgi:copper oxidase (laccase) domain-containing protein